MAGTLGRRLRVHPTVLARVSGKNSHQFYNHMFLFEDVLQRTGRT